VESAYYSRIVTEATAQQEPADEHDREALPGVQVTMNQVIASNVTFFRRAAGLTQAQLGARIGWSFRAVSAAERTAARTDGKGRLFDAQTIVELSMALGVPLLALFLPPDEPDTPYLFPGPGGKGLFDMDDLMQLVMPDMGEDTPAANAYRDRFQRAVTRHVDEEWAGEVASWLREAEDAEARADRRGRLLAHVAGLRGLIREIEGLADAIGPDEEDE